MIFSPADSSASNANHFRGPRINGYFITTEMLPLGRYLTTSKAIRVPEYQRSYAWTDDEVLQLWDDLIDSMENNRPEYFIGPIVVKKNEGSPAELIDGQQRLTTALVIIGIIQRIFRVNGDSQRADLLSSRFFGEKDILTLKMAEKFLMNEENAEMFRRFVSTEADRDTIKKEQKKYLKKNSNFALLQAILMLWESIEKHQGNEYNLDVLLKILEYLTEQVKILVLSVEDEADAYTIFETLNDRGRSLDTLDLLKNHLFSKAKSCYLPEVKDKWSAVRENLFEIDPKNRFLYHFWLSLYGRTSKTGLFRTMRDHVQTAQNAVEFSNKLARAARLYVALQTPSSAVWDDHEPATRKHIASLQLLDAQQALPILLAAEENFDITEFNKLAYILVVMAVRYTFIGEERTGVAANYYADIPKKIRSSEFKKAAHVFKHLKPIYPSDESFESAFKIKTITDSRRARYILAELENRHSGSEKIVNSDLDQVNLEHILPKNINQNWSPANTKLASEEHALFVNRIGNLALVSKTKNKNVGSKDFSSKKTELFTTSEFLTSRKISEFSEWTKASIIARQETLAKIAVTAWRIDS